MRGWRVVIAGVLLAGVVLFEGGVQTRAAGAADPSAGTVTDVDPLSAVLVTTASEMNSTAIAD